MNHNELIYRKLRTRTLANLQFAEKVAEKTAECMAEWGEFAASQGYEAEVCRGLHFYEGGLNCVRLLLDVMLKQLEDDGQQEPVDDLCRAVRM